MGLDSVGLVMRIERDFDLDIRDEDAAHLGTVGDLAGWIRTAQAEKQRSGGPTRPWPEAAILERLRTIIHETSGVPLTHITPQAHLARDLGIN